MDCFNRERKAYAVDKRTLVKAQFENVLSKEITVVEPEGPLSDLFRGSQ